MRIVLSDALWDVSGEPVLCGRDKPLPVWQSGSGVGLLGMIRSGFGGLPAPVFEDGGGLESFRFELFVCLRDSNQTRSIESGGGGLHGLAVGDLNRGHRMSRPPT